MIAAETCLPVAGAVLVEEQHLYGITAHLPANTLARALCAIAHTKIMTSRTVEAAKRMGFTVQTTGAQPRQL